MNIQQTQSQHLSGIVLVTKQKSIVVACILAFLFGPLGLLYTSLTGVVIMSMAGCFLFYFLSFWGVILVWTGCILWAIVAIRNANNRPPQQARVKYIFSIRQIKRSSAVSYAN